MYDVAMENAAVKICGQSQVGMCHSNFVCVCIRVWVSWTKGGHFDDLRRDGYVKMESKEVDAVESDDATRTTHEGRADREVQARKTTGKHLTVRDFIVGKRGSTTELLCHLRDCHVLTDYRIHPFRSPLKHKMWQDCAHSY